MIRTATRRPDLLAAVFAALALGSAGCIPGPVAGPEFVVNAATAGSQEGPLAAQLGPGGNFVVVWTDTAGTDGDSFGVRARMFDATGAPLGGEFTVTSTTAGAQFSPSVASNAAGNFVVSWTDNGGTGAPDVFARRFDASGAPMSGDIAVNTYTTSQQEESSVAMDDSGNFVVVWRTVVGQLAFSIFGQRFDAAGAKVGQEFQVNQHTPDSQTSPRVVMRPNGEYLVVWMNPQDDDGYGILARRYGADGTPLSGEIPVNTFQTSGQITPDVEYAADGSAVVVWVSGGNHDGDGSGIYGQRLSPSGAKLGPEFNVNTFTTGSQYGPAVAVGPGGEFVVLWDSLNDGDVWGVAGQAFEANGRRLGQELLVNTYDEGSQGNSDIVAQPSGQFVAVWQSDGVDGSVQGIAAKLGGFPRGGTIAVDAPHPGAAAGASNQNGILEPEETVALEPSFRNGSTSSLPLTGTMNDFRGSGAEAIDTAADYGTIAAGGSNDCFSATGDCYRVRVTGQRPDTHWDAFLDEQLSYHDWGRTTAIHVGGSFPDVPQDSFYPFIENLLHNEVTGGCGGGLYCPLNNVTRGQMAVFLLKARWGAGFIPVPPTGGVFNDVTAVHPFGAWIEELAREGITGGCGGGNYCPDSPVNRQQMAVFLLKTKFGSTYAPPNGTGIFGDVAPCPGSFCNFIEDLYNRQVTGGCQAIPLRYCPGNFVLRRQMAVFLVKNFLLELYGN